MSGTSGTENSVNVVTRDTELPLVVSDCGLSVFVVFTSVDSTLKALEKARELAEPLGANIVILAVQVVPYPLPLDRPPVPFEFVVKRFEERAQQFAGKIQVSAYLCRDLMEALKQILNSYSPVVIGGGRKRWMPTREQKLVRKLRLAGYDVISVNQE